MHKHTALLRRGLKQLYCMLQAVAVIAWCVTSLEQLDLSLPVVWGLWKACHLVAEPDACWCSGVAAGLQGQLHAVWKHRVSKREAATIVQAQIPVLVLHGRHDILAMPGFGEQLAHRSMQRPYQLP